VRPSDGRARLGHSTGQGSPALRWALVEAAQHGPRGGGPLRDAYERITKRRGKSTAKLAVARKIHTPCFYGPRDGQIRCQPPRAKTAHAKNDGGRTTTRRETAAAPDPEATRGHSSELVRCQSPPPAQPDRRRPPT
jgi:hypothetical protein